jgi:hypothetical protein
VLHIVKQVKRSQLNDALLALPFSIVMDLIKCISEWVSKVTNIFNFRAMILFIPQKFFHFFSNVTMTK